MSSERKPVAVGETVAYWDKAGQAHVTMVKFIDSHGGRALLEFEGGGKLLADRFPGDEGASRNGHFDALEFEGVDPLEPPPPPRLRDPGPNPIKSIVEWAGAVVTTFKMGEALCMEEMSEVMSNFYVHDGATRDTEQWKVAAALKEYSLLLRNYGELCVASNDLNALVDGHLDSAWVHLLAASTIVGPENLSEAWSRLHKANIDDKLVDGAYIKDSTGKVIKPEGWVAPTYIDLIKKEIV